MPRTQSPPIVRREARLVAAAVDLFIIALLGAVCLALAALAMLLQVDPRERDPTAGEWAVGYAVAGGWFLLAALYAGLGARTLGARLLRLQEPHRSARTFLIRALIWWPSALLLAVGLWWPWLDHRGRSLPELVGGSCLLEPVLNPALAPARETG